MPATDLLTMLYPFDEMLGENSEPFTWEEILRTSYRPTVIIGLGGTGHDVVRKLKRRIESYYGIARSKVFQYLVIDTTAEKTRPGELPLGQSIFYQAENFQAAEMVANLEDDEPIKKWWMYPHMPSYTGEGAGAIRAVGRLVLFRYASDINARIEQKIKAATEVKDEGVKSGSVKIYIVSSLAGGTGSGMFLDVAYLARNAVATHTKAPCYVTGVLVMPSAFEALAKAPDQRYRWRANAYSALRELDMLTYNKAFRQDYTSKFHVGRKVTVTRPFNVTYLISLSNENSLTLANFDSLTEMISEEMMMEIASPMQGEMSNQLDNIQETDHAYGGHPYAYSSFSVASLVYPLRGVASWCGLKFTSPFIHDVLLKPLRSTEDADAEVEKIIDELKLREKGADQMIEQIALDREQQVLSASSVDFGSLQGVRDEDILSTFQFITKDCLEVTEKSKKEMTARRADLQVALPPRLRARIKAMAQDPERGPAYTDIALTFLENKLRAYRTEEMLLEQKQFQDQFSSSQDLLDTTQADLEKAINSRLPWKHGRVVRSANEYISAYNIRLHSDFQAALRENAAILFGTLLDLVGALQRQIRDLITELRNAADAASASAEQARVRMMAIKPSFTLIKPIINENELNDTYERYKPAYELPEQKRDLITGFWKFVQAQAPKWEPGSKDAFREGFRALPFYYLGESYHDKLVVVPLLARLKDKAAQSVNPRAHDLWMIDIADRYEQAAPFWDISLTRRVADITDKLTRAPNLVGYGEVEDITHWSQDVTDALGETITAVQTKNQQEMVFLKTVHGLPLFAVYEVDAQLKDAYDDLQREWEESIREWETHKRTGGVNTSPLHASRVWEREVKERDRRLAENAKKKTKATRAPENLIPQTGAALMPAART